MCEKSWKCTTCVLLISNRSFYQLQILVVDNIVLYVVRIEGSGSARVKGQQKWPWPGPARPPDSVGLFFFFQSRCPLGPPHSLCLVMGSCSTTPLALSPTVNCFQASECIPECQHLFLSLTTHFKYDPVGFPLGMESSPIQSSHKFHNLFNMTKNYNVISESAIITKW